MSGSLHIIKLCVGIEKVSDLAQWRAIHAAEAAAEGRENVTRHITRMRPRREDELLDGGSLYWVIKGMVQVRQKIIRLDEVIGEDGIRRCGIIMEPDLIQTTGQPRRPFQGWRYLNGTDTPQDIGPYKEGQVELPSALQAELAALGVL